jgi:integrase
VKKNLERRQRRKEPVTVDEINAVLGAAWGDHRVYGIRDTCVIFLLYGFGFRDQQLALLRLEDYNEQTGLLKIRSPKLSVVQLSPTAQFILDRWIKVRGNAPGWLINPIRRPDQIIPKVLSRGALWAVLVRRTQEAGITPFSPDDIVCTHNLITRGVWDRSFNDELPSEQISADY